MTVIEPETLFGKIDLDLSPDDNALCRWFNVESEPRIGESLGITLQLMVCPEGFDAKAGDYNTCNLPLPEPITFDFIHNGQVLETGTATAPETSLTVKLNGGKPESGEWTLRPTVWENRAEPGWSCYGVDAAGTISAGIEYFSPADRLPGISAKFGPNLRLECNAWLYSTVFTESASVSLFTCPDGFDPAVTTDPDRKAACTPESYNDVTFAVDGEVVATERTNDGGRITSPVAPGLNRISVDSGEGFVTGFVVCDQTRTDLNQIQTIEVPVNSDGASISIELDANDKLACEWFLVPGVPPAADDGDDAAGDETTDDAVGDETTDDAVGDDATDGATGDGTTDDTAGDETTDDVADDDT